MPSMTVNQWNARRGKRDNHLLTKIVALIGVLALMLLGSALPASAHNVLVSSDPADGATLDAAPETVSFTFDQPIQNYDPVLNVFGPNGNSFVTAQPTVAGSTVSAPFEAGAAGEYRAVYRIISTDGHPVSGQIFFTLSEAAAGDATGTPVDDAAEEQADGDHDMGEMGDSADTAGDSSDSGGIGLWLWIGIGIAVVLVGSTIVLALRKPSGPKAG